MLANDIKDENDAGRKNTDEADSDLAAETRQMPSAGVMFGVGMAIIGLGVLGWMIYRSRRRETLVRRLTEALPSSMGDLRDELGERWKRVRSRAS